MSRSIKSVLVEIAPIIGESADSLYGTMRDLMDAGALHRRPGHGPGSGVEATYVALAKVLAVHCTSRRPVDAVRINQAAARP